MPVGVAGAVVVAGALVAVDRLPEVGSADVVGAVVSSSVEVSGAGVVVSSSPAVVRGARLVLDGVEVGVGVAVRPGSESPPVEVGVGAGVRLSWEERTTTSPYSVGTVT